MLDFWSRIRQHLRRWGIGIMHPEPEEPDVEYPSLLEALTITFPPSPAFVSDLEMRIRAAYPRAVVPSRKEHRRLSRLGLAFASTFIIAATGLLVVWALGLLSPVQRIQFVPEKVFAAAYDALLSVDTVSYDVDIEVSHGVCGARFDAPLTEEELESLDPSQRPADGMGTIISCGSGPQRFAEFGEYDLENKAFHSLTQGFYSDSDTSADQLTWSMERTYIDGRLYTREVTGEWVEQSASALWVPFSAADIGGIPSDGLDALRQTYDNVEDLGIERLDGVEVRVFKASRTQSLSGISEGVTVWVGTRDGLPRKAVLEASQPESPVSDVLDMLHKNPELMNPGGAFYEFKNDPVVIRGDQPTHKTIQWTYTFDRFNEPVEIQAPTSQEGR
jgi:hypothetical protein